MEPAPPWPAVDPAATRPPARPDADETQPDGVRRRRPRRPLVAALAIVLGLGVVALLLRTVGPGILPQGPQSPADSGPPGRPSAIVEQRPERSVPAPTEYVIEPGDSLVAIADKFGTSMDALRIANDLADVDMVQIGRVLTVPPAETLVEPVEPSRTLREIARRYEIDPATLAAYNGLEAALVDAPLGRDQVVVPDFSRLAVPGSEAPPFLEETVYTVAEGDTLLSIAAQFDVEPEAVLAANQRDDPNVIVVGEQLRIPAAD